MIFRLLGSFFNPRRSLQAQIGLLFGGLTILLTTLLSVAVGQQSKARIESNTGRSMEQMAHQLTDDLDRGTYDYYLQTQDIARQTTITDSQATLDGKRAVLDHTLTLHDDIAWISLVGVGGRVVLSTTSTQEGQNVSAEDWYAQTTPTTADVQVTDVVLSPTTPPSAILLYVMARWKDEKGQPLGLVITAVRSTFVDERVAELLESATFDNLHVIVTQADGTVIASTDPTMIGRSWADQPSYEMSTHQPYGHRIESVDGDEKYLTGYAVMDGFRNFPGLEWRVMVRKDAATAFEPANNLMRSLLFTGVLLAIGFAVVGWSLGSRITRPLVRMAASADAIRGGQTLVQLPILEGEDEVARLGHSLRTLVAQLTHEIDERRTLETQFRAMFELSLDAILVADGHNGTILQVNPASKRLLGYEPEALVGKPFVSLFPPEQASRDEIIERLKVYGAVFEEQEFLRQDGGTVLMDLTATLMPYRGKNGILITLRDITERHQLMLAQLESDAMRNQLAVQEQALNLKSTIVSVASHDLRNPLATILLSTDIIKRYGDRIPEEKRVGHFLRIETSIKYMQKLLDDLNLMDKLERGLVKPAPDVIDMPEFCNTLMDEALATTEIVRPFQFTLDPACTQIIQDPRLLRQAISNLLTNALKYSREGTPIEFSVNLAPDGQLRIVVRDYGIGIPLKDQENLFKSFHRAKNASGIPGTGLGLAITHRAVDSMQGTLAFVSVENQGTTFTILLPLILPPKNPAYQSTTIPHSA
ncbi:MAG: PAS domain S-box protein [Anaerolineae bacterium]|nr:PAS domain S-box protein [Anaerolineae bacterium]